MTGPDSDNDFDDLLARRSPLHRRLADSDAHEPPAELDRIVLAKARDAIKRPSETPVFRSPQWAMPVGLAASVLLIFAVVLNFARVTRQPGTPAAPMAANAPAAAPTHEIERARVAGESDSAAKPADSKAEAYAAPPPALASRDALLAKEVSAPPALRAEQETPPSTPAVADNASSPLLTARAKRAPAAEPSVDVRTASNMANGTAGTPIVTPDAAESVGAPPAAPVVAQAAPPLERPEVSSSPLSAGTAAAMSASDQSARSDEAKKDYTASTGALAGAPSSVGALEEVTTVGARRVRGGTKRPAASSTPAAIAAEKVRHPDADAWLRDIEALRAAGRDADARHELDAFRKTYPDHPVALSKDEPPPAQ